MAKNISKKDGKKTPFFKRKSIKITAIVLGSALIIAISFFAFIFASGKQMLSTITGRNQSIIKALTSDVKLRGESEDRINVLFMGIGGSNHPGGQLTDSMMLVSIKPREHAMAMMSIPRDLYVPIADHKTSSKLNEVYNVGDKEKKGSGPTLVKKTVGQITGLSIDYYVTVDFDGFEKFIDQIGGVDVNVEKALNDPYYPDERMEGYAPFSIKAGQQHLDGKTALKFARSRETTSDFDRAARQQKIVMAVKDKILKLGFLANPKKIFDLVALVGDHVRTDFTPAELKTLAGIFKQLDNGKTVTKVLSNAADGPLVSDSSSGTYYLLPKDGDFKAVQNIAKNIFVNPDDSEKTVKVEVLNGSKTVGLASKVADQIKDLGYTVSNVDNASESVAKTVIYDYTNGTNKSVTDVLKNMYLASVVSRDRPANSNIDISIVIGDNHIE